MRALFVTVLFMTFFSHVSTGFAQEEFPKPTPSHNIGFTFHKLAGTEPNYEKWVSTYIAKDFRDYGEEGKKALRRRTRSMFVNQFKNFSYEDNNIIINLPANLEIVPFENKYLANVDFGQQTLFLYKETPEFNINFVIPDIESKFKTVISKNTYDEIKQNSGRQFVKPESVVISLEITPASVDAEKPLIINGQEYWMLLASFEGYEIWNKRKQNFYWRYTSQEDIDRKLNDLRSLYKPKNQDQE